MSAPVAISADKVPTLTAKPVEYVQRPTQPQLDTSDPVAIEHRIGQLADELHELGPWHAYCAGRYIELKEQLTRAELNAWPKMAPDAKLARDRQAALQAHLEAEQSVLLDARVAVEAHLELCRKRLDYLQSELMACQSLLRRHTEADRHHGHGQSDQPQRPRRAT